MVKSVSKAVYAIVNNDLSLQDALHRRYANYSAVARIMKPLVEREVGHRVKLDTLITAVRRTQVAFKHPPGRVKQIIAKSVINLRSDVAKVSVEKSKRTVDVVRRTLAEFRGEFLEVLEGITSVTFLVDRESFKGLLSQFRREEILDQRMDLAAIVIQSPRDIVDAPGCITAFYNQLARMHMNVQETVSCYTETIIVLGMEDVGRAISALSDMINEARG